MIDNITAPLAGIQKSLAGTDKAAHSTEKALSGIGDLSNTDFGFGFQNLGKQLKGAQQEAVPLTSAIDDIKKAAIGYFTATKAFDVASQIFTTGSNMEQTRIAFKVLLQDADLAKEKLGELQEFADVSPFSTSEVYDAGQALLGFGVKANDLLPVMGMLGDASSGNANKFKSLVDNYGKLVSAQRANTMDLNQFALQGIPIWDALGKKVGKSGADLKDYVEKNGVAASTVTELLRGMTEQGGQFFGMMDEQSQSTAGMWSTFESKIEATYVKIYDKLQPIINATIQLATNYYPMLENALSGVYNLSVDTWNAMESISHWIAANNDLFIGLGITLAGLAGVWFLANAEMLLWNAGMWAGGAALTAFEAIEGIVTATTGGLAAAVEVLNAAMLATPIGVVILALIALAGLIYIAWERCETFRGAVYGIGAAVMEIGSVLYDFGMNVIDIFSGIGDLISAVFSFDLDAIKSATDKVTETFSNAFSADKFSEYGERIGGAFADGFDDGYLEGLSINANRNAEDKVGAVASGDEEFQVAGVGGGSASGTSAAEAAKQKSVVTASNASGGDKNSASGKIINVRIENLAKEIKLYSSTIKEGAQDIRKILNEQLTAAVRDFEIGMSNGN